MRPAYDKSAETGQTFKTNAQSRSTVVLLLLDIF